LGAIVAIAPKKGILQHISGVALGVKSSSGRGEITLLGWFVLFQSLFYLLFWSSNLNLFEFKTKFEFNPRHSLK
jgi:hypothetical protein